jgi:hypothetical protein
MNQIANSFPYEPLPPIAEQGRTPPFTRLLYLASGVGNEDPLSGHLEHVNVEQAPPYEALSYTWGSPTEEPTDYIWLQGHPMLIKPNLEAALKSLRLPNQARRLWVDALCINQEDAEERARQVQYMRSVYTHSTRLIVWLGLKTAGVEVAFEAARRLADVHKYAESIRLQSPGNQAPDPELISAYAVSAIEDLPENAMQTLHELFERPYFTRCWCIQEVVTCKWGTAKVEELEIPIFDLLSTVLTIAQWQGEMRIDTPFQLWHQIYEHRQSRTPMSRSEVEGSIGTLLHLLDVTRSLKATDDRDKIFSLFGISDEGIQPVLALTQVMGSSNNGWMLRTLRQGMTRMQNYVNEMGPGMDFGRPKALKPDYTRDTVDVYADLTRFLLRKSPRMMDVLHYVQHVDDIDDYARGVWGEDRAGHHPTWVPKWFEARNCTPMNGCFLAGLCDGHFRYFAELHDIPIRTPSTRPRVLSLDGFYVDAVHAVGDAMDLKAPLVDDNLDVLQAAWNRLFPFPIAPRTRDMPRYRTTEMQLDEAFGLACVVSPLGSVIGSSLARQENQTGFGVHFGNPENMSMDQHKENAKRCVGSFLNSLARRMTGIHQDDQQAPDGFFNSFIIAARMYCNNRRIVVTRDGRIGIGPKAMRPGDEIAVFFGGRLPFVIRRAKSFAYADTMIGGVPLRQFRPAPEVSPGLIEDNYHTLVGTCYLVDEELMWGKVTEIVRYRRGGPPVATFELR